jgi:hypothetical protein
MRKLTVSCRRASYYKADARDAQLFRTYARMRLTVRGRHAILSGIAGFNRNVSRLDRLAGR